MPLTALHGGEILPERTLPRRYTAFTPCYRREAGTYGKDMKGMFRQHQFDKVELVKLTTPAQSYDELESMVRERRGSAAAARAALPRGRALRRRPRLQRRQGLRHRGLAARAGQVQRDLVLLELRRLRRPPRGHPLQPESGGKTEFCHTLNGSGLAVGRTLIAVLENYQNADGTVIIPDALRPYMDGLQRIEALPA